MAHQRPLEPKLEPKELTISLEDFMRTRDQVVTGLTTLIGAVNDLNRAYLNHTNDLLKGAGHAPIESIAISNFYSMAKNLSNGIGGEKLKRKRQKKEKDPNAPKRPLTAFFLYSTHARPLVRKDMGDATPPVEINNEILRRWTSMAEPEKAKWKQQYEKNKEQYDIETAAYKASKGEDVAAGAGADDAAGLMDAEADSDSESEDQAPPSPVKEPTPPPAKAKGKGGKRKSAAAAARSPSPSAQLKETPVPLPGNEVKMTPAEKRKKAKAEEPAEEPKRKRAKKSDAKDIVVEVATPATAEKRSKKRK